MQKQKEESTQITIVKTLLAVLLFAGVGTIIIGGGYIIREYSKNMRNNQITEPVEQEVEDYYSILKKECPLSSCYLSSLGYMKENNYKKTGKFGRCPEGFVNKRLECHNSLSWCRPVVTKDDILFNTDKIKYEQEEKIEFIIENKLDEKIEYSVSLVEKRNSSFWKVVNYDIFCSAPSSYPLGSSRTLDFYK